MKRVLCYFAACFFFLTAYPLHAEKFPSSWSATDSLPQNQAKSLKSKPLSSQATQRTSPVALPQQQSTPVAWSPQAAGVPDIPKLLSGTLPSLAQRPSPAPALPSPSSALDLKKTKITVPDFEKRFRDLMQAEQIAKTQKKKNLFESILDEVSRYGYLMVLGLIVFIVIVTLRKEKTSPPPIGTASKEEAGKNIWHEDF